MNKNGQNWEYCEECGIYSLVDDENVCVDCKQEATENEDEED